MRSAECDVPYAAAPQISPARELCGQALARAGSFSRSAHEDCGRRLVDLPTLRGRFFWDRLLGGLELFGALVAQRTVQSFAIVEHFDEYAASHAALASGMPSTN